MTRPGFCSGLRLGAIHDLTQDVRWKGEELLAEALRRSRIVRQHTGADKNLFVIAHTNSPSFFADLFAVWEVGGCAVCVNSGLSDDELQNVVEFTQPRAVLVNHDTERSLPVPTLRTADEMAPDTVDSAAGGSPDDPALILFTSGTSGEPKGVVHTFRSLLTRVSLNQAHIGTEDLARSLCVLPTHFGHGLIGNCLTPLLAGCDVCLMPGAGITGAAQLGSVIDQHGITFLSSVPGVWRVALRVSAPPTGGTLSRVSIGSAPLSSDLWRDVIEWSGAPEVVNMYGITETANWIAGASSAKFTPEDGLLGTLWGGQAAVLTSEGSVERIGEGELLLHVPSVMTSYYNRSDLTSDVLQNGWFHTGDTGSIDENGVLRLTGRNRYAINRDGIKIYPEELDLLFERHDEVVEACAFAIDDSVSGQVVALAARLADGSQTDEAALQEWARERIRPEAVPQRVFVVNDIPKTDRGKINRDIVATACLDGERRA